MNSVGLAVITGKTDVPFFQRTVSMRAVMKPDQPPASLESWAFTTRCPETQNPDWNRLFSGLQAAPAGSHSADHS